MKIKPEDPVGRIAKDLTAAIPYFEHNRIDYTWRGDASLREACDEAGIPVDEALDSLERIYEQAKTTWEEWDQRSVSEVIEEVMRHHLYTRDQIDKINSLLDEAVRANSFTHPQLLILKDLFREMTNELRGHMAKEEERIFPYLSQREKGKEAPEAIPNPFQENPFFRQPLRILQWEHRMTGEEWAQIRFLTDGFSLHRNEEPSLHHLYTELLDLERDLHVHVHLENNVLFRRAIDNGWLE